jgi:hypothetical protein
MIDELNEAYGVLGTPRLREQYDAFRDDVLIRSGMLKPVTSRQKQERAPKQDSSAKAKKKRKATHERSAPAVKLPEHWRTYAVSAAVALLAFAAAWQGVNIVLVVVALAVGLGFSLAPTVSRKMADLSFELPAVSVPDIKVPRVEMPGTPAVKLREFSGVDKEEGIDADTLSRSTRDTIARWRTSVGLKVTDFAEDGAPLEPLDDVMPPAPDPEADPFSTVMDILRSGAKATPDRARTAR